MQKRLLSLVMTASTVASLALPMTVRAGDCFSDPVFDHDWSATVTVGARVRDVACMEGSTVMTTLAVGSKIKVTGETDGWWRVKTTDGKEGWVGQQLLTVRETPFVASEVRPTETVRVQRPAAARLRGMILLQVERNGEAWYVSPVDGARYYMKNGEVAYKMMRSFGLGMNEADYKRLEKGDRELIKRLLGRIVLRVNAKGEAYYIHPNGTVHYLKDGAAAYELMRKLSLGIKNTDLDEITEKEVE